MVEWRLLYWNFFQWLEGIARINTNFSLSKICQAYGVYYGIDGYAELQQWTHGNMYGVEPPRFIPEREQS